MKLAVALILSLLLIGTFSAEAAGRINAAAVTPQKVQGSCDYEHVCSGSSADDECKGGCIAKGYDRGWCVNPIGGHCCCLKGEDMYHSLIPA
ncbi:hypothetical protein MKW94_026175 [Papaver nudicaule]|uniref:Uncharacterized protein n=1 Tax=Papaver nudicaule TaxID=74823 RepID=A0AA41SE94_PAPNU|nr:hypothetical protein [Papaver nudicaule]